MRHGGAVGPGGAQPGRTGAIDAIAGLGIGLRTGGKLLFYRKAGDRAVARPRPGADFDQLVLTPEKMSGD